MKTHFQLTGISFLLILAIAPLKNTHAQGFYFNVGGGYGFNTTNITAVDFCEGFENTPYYYYPNEAPFAFIGSNQTYTETTQNNATTWTNTYQSLNKGLGGGFSFYASAGYSFSKYFSAEIGFSYLAGISLQSSYTDNSYDYGIPDDTSVNNQSNSNKMTCSARYRLLPAVKFSIPISKFTPYVKAGLVVGLGGKITVSNSFAENDYTIYYGRSENEGNDAITTGLTASGGLSLGYTTSVGAEYAITDFLSVYAELNLISENWSPANGDITSYTETENGQVVPLALTSNQFTYSNTVTTGGSNQSSANVVQVYSQYPKQTLFYGSYGFNIGVKFSIAKKAKPIAPPASQVAPK